MDVSGKAEKWAAALAALAAVAAVSLWWLPPGPAGDSADSGSVAGSEQPAADPPSPVQETQEPDLLGGGRAILVVTTDPPGVQVSVGGEVAGETPLERSDVRAGTHDVQLLHPDYEPLELAGQVFSDGRVVRVERTLVRGTGSLTVISQPREAWVELDGVLLAEGTPVTLDDLPAGSVRLRLGAASHLSEEVVASVPKDGLGFLEWELEPGEPEPDAVQAASPPPQPQPEEPQAQVPQPHVPQPEEPQSFTVEAAPPEPTDLPDNMSTSGRVNVGGTATGNIDFDDDRDWFRVELDPGDYVIDLEGAPTGAGTLDDPFLHGIHDSTGRLIVDTSDDDEGEGTNARVFFLPPGGGVYYIAAGGYVGARGTYTLRVTLYDGSFEIGDLPDHMYTIGAVYVGGSATGTISFDEDRDWFRVELDSGQPYIIDLEGAPTGAGTLDDPFLYGIHDSRGRLIADTSDDDGGESTNSRVTFRPTQSGDYYISAGGFAGTNQGSYTLSVTPE